MYCRIYSVLFFLLLAGVGEAQRSDVERRSIGSDGLVTVYGDDVQLRRAILTLVTNLRQDVLRLYQSANSKDEWKHGIVIELHKPRPGIAAPKVGIKKQLLIVGDAFRLQLDLAVAAGIDRKRLQREIVNLLVIENSLRKADVADEREWKSPTWLVEGLLEALEWEGRRGDRELYSTVLKSGMTMSLEELLSIKDVEILDPIAGMEFKVWSGALVMSLLDAAGKKDGIFQEFLGEIAGFDGVMSVLFGKHFPSMNISTNSLKKWVTLKIATLAQAKTTEVYTVFETEKLLAEILTYEEKIEDHPPVRKNLWLAIDTMGPNQRIDVVNAKVQSLYRLSYRCFPLTRPILYSYAQILQIEGADSDKRKQILIDLQRQRKRLLIDAERARDFLDYLELNAGVSGVGELENYVSLKKDLRKKDSARKDGISLYLDQMNEFLLSE